MDVVLVMFTPEGERKDVPMRHSKATLGRDKSCDIRIPVAAVSRRHCELRVEDDELLVKDLGSRNGTYRNEERVEGDEPLSPGDRLAVGPIVFTVQIDGDPAYVEPPLLESPAVNAQDGGDAAPPTGPGGPSAGSPDDSAAGISDLLADMGDDSSAFDFDFDDEDDDEKSGA